ncbi:sodium:calcium antiporter [Roseovarius sp. D22-M7]|uniref:sodium:calcium antiporter n=1 Tax=Roseovarius sp. D22-M7 TaxID=3127116 RepID=UPI0030100082
MECASERLSAYYRLPDIVQGPVVVAIGSSFPELSTVVISAALHGAFDVGVAAIVRRCPLQQTGDILLIPGLAGLVGREQISTNRDLFYKESQFYIIAVAILTLSFSFAVISFPVDRPPGTIQGEMTRGLAIVPLPLSLRYVFVQHQDTLDHEGKQDLSDIRPLREWGQLGMPLVIIVVGMDGLVRAAINFGEIFDTPGFL